MTESKKKPTARKSCRSSSAGGDKLYVNQVRQLVDLMVSNELTELEIVNGDLKVSLGRGNKQIAAAAAPVAAAPAAAPAPVAAAPAAAADQSVDDGLLEITSPMVGVFYAAPSPDSDPYVKVGDNVNGETVVCIVEAMKVMNEIKAECSGQIAEICVENGQAIEYGQVLLKVKP